jgi:hypothetical protein
MDIEEQAMPHILVIQGSTRDGRFSDKVAALASLDPQLDLLAEDLLWWADALKAARGDGAVAA